MDTQDKNNLKEINQGIKDLNKKFERLINEMDRERAKRMFNETLLKMNNQNDWFNSKEADAEFKRFLEKNDINKQSEK